MATTLDIRRLDRGSRVLYIDPTPGRSRQGLGPAVPATVTRVHYSRQAVDILDDQGQFRECVSAESLRPAEPDVERRRYAREGQDSRPGGVLDVGSEASYLGAPARILRRRRAAEEWVFDIVVLLGPGRDLILSGVGRDRLGPADESGRPRGLDPEARSEFVRYCRDRNVTSSSEGAMLYGSFLIHTPGEAVRFGGGG